MQMLRTAASLLFCLLLSTPAYSNSGGCRADQAGSLTIGECAEQLFNSSDVELNAKYQSILKGLKTSAAEKPYLARAREQLIISQRSWLKYRDNDCKALAASFPDDPSNHSRHSVCLLERTTQRVKELDDWTEIASQQANTAPSSTAPSFAVVKYGQSIAGQPLSVWIQRYWQWQRSFPAGNQPSDDTTGAMCGIRQNQDVFFLSGSSGKPPVQRQCTIPKNKYILVPIINILAQKDDPGTTPCDAFMQAVRQVNKSAADLALTINGQTVGDIMKSEAESGCFYLKDATRNVSGTAAGAGYWAVLEPLAPGNYLLNFKGTYTADGFSQDVTYQIHVE